jgi:hypothetical protein
MYVDYVMCVCVFYVVLTYLHRQLLYVQNCHVKDKNVILFTVIMEKKSIFPLIL